MEILSARAMMPGNSPEQESTKKRHTNSLVLSWFLLAAGCTTTDSFVFRTNEKPMGAPCRVVVAWAPEVRFAPDPAHGGVPSPGIAGRIFLFGEEITSPFLAEGAVVIDVNDDTPGKGNAALPLEEWRIDKDTLKRLERRDAVGWGYTIFLPWATYKPEIKQVQMRLRFEPANGPAPLYADVVPITFKNNAVSMSIQSSEHVIKSSAQNETQAKRN